MIKNYQEFKADLIELEQTNEGIRDVLRNVIKKGRSYIDNLMKGDSLKPEEMKKNKENLRKSLKKLMLYGISFLMMTILPFLKNGLVR
jgi:predicted translin family RNA/ssDNA-binding protein